MGGQRQVKRFPKRKAQKKPCLDWRNSPKSAKVNVASRILCSFRSQAPARDGIFFVTGSREKPMEFEPPDLTSAVLSDRMLLQVPSRMEWIEPTVEYLRRRAVLSGACGESRSTALLIALHEALSNAIIHGNLEISSVTKESDDNAFMELLATRSGDPNYNSRVVEILVEYDGQRCQWTLADQGNGFDVDRVMARACSDEPSELPSGRGILMMTSFMDQVRYEDGGRRVHLVLHQLSGQERRKQPRIPVLTKLQVAPIHPDGTVDWQAAHDAVSRNFSMEGISLLQSSLAQTDRVLIGIETGGKPMYIPAEVRHWKSHPDDLVELGCWFGPTTMTAPNTRADTPGEVKEVIGKLLESVLGPSLPAEERRADPRMAYNHPVRIYRDKGSEPLTAFPRDLSRGGIAFLTTESLHGQVIVALTCPKQPPLRVRAEIQRCSMVQEGFYDIGARFLAVES
jgi:anti-sigma regulatory factor (Ser/Thr protein kinase)